MTVSLFDTPGSLFTRSVMALGLGGDRGSAALIARNRWRDTPSIAEHFGKTKSGEVSAASTENSPELMFPGTREFLEVVRPRTILGKLLRKKRVPFYTGAAFAVGGAVFSWVRESGAIPVGLLSWQRASLPVAKAAGIIVLTQELLLHTSPAGEAVVREECANGLIRFLDRQLVDPTVAGTAENPASLTYLAPTIASSGTDVADVRADLIALLQMVADAMETLDGVVLLMSDVNGFALGAMLAANGGPAFPGLGAAGGSLFGVPVIVSSVLGDQIVALHSPSFLLADEGRLEVDLATHASLAMQEDPDTPAELVSLWQANSVGLRFKRIINWELVKPLAVAVLTGADYSTPAS
jgi:HK97 family phage major capsid protein